jgi:hypothetical protein
LTTRKNQNSILVLATLGVYLGLVLVGATPQVLAQAAMTRQFNIKDEVEFAEDLYKKPPENSDVEDTTNIQPEADKLVSSSVAKFLSTFARVATVQDRSPDLASTPLLRSICPMTDGTHRVLFPHSLSAVLTVSNLPRAGLDSLAAMNAK